MSHWMRGLAWGAVALLFVSGPLAVLWLGPRTTGSIATRSIIWRDALALIARCPRATALVEIKQESLHHWGADQVLDAIDRALTPHRDRCIPISYSRAALEGMRDRGAPRVGWVLSRYDREARQQALQLAPQLLICNQRKLPAGARPWPGDWQWMLYDITDPARALDWAARGVDLIETGDPARLLADPVLARAACRHDRS